MTLKKFNGDVQAWFVIIIFTYVFTDFFSRPYSLPLM